MIFWYQKFDFLKSEIIIWYQKVEISENRIYDIRKCMNFKKKKNRDNFLTSENDFLISENQQYIPLRSSILLPQSFSPVNDHAFSLSACLLRILFLFLFEGYGSPKYTRFELIYFHLEWGFSKLLFRTFCFVLFCLCPFLLLLVTPPAPAAVGKQCSFHHQ